MMALLFPGGAWETFELSATLSRRMIAQRTLSLSSFTETNDGICLNFWSWSPDSDDAAEDAAVAPSTPSVLVVEEGGP